MATMRTGLVRSNRYVFVTRRMELMDIIMKVKVKLSVCLTKHHTMKTYWGSGGIAPRILDLGTRWR
jgi:hypothetical protein